MRWGCAYEGRRDEQGKDNFGIGVLAVHRPANLPLLSFKTHRVSRNQGITVFLFHNQETRIVQ